MKHFTVRFEIINPSSTDYINLKALLLAINFTKIIKSTDGTPYILPQGEYRISGQYSKDEVLNIAISAIQKITNAYRVLVTQSAGTAWTGLKNG